MPPRLLLRSSWQTVNIGDIGHTPGALRILEQHLPEAEITLWPSSVDRGVREQLLQRWPRLKIVEGDIGEDGQASSWELANALQENDLFVHGSGPNLMAPHHLDAWRRTGKPYGFFGITMDPLGFGASGEWEGGTLDDLRARLAALPLDSMSRENQDRLSGAAFLFLRDTLTLEHIRRQVPGARHAAFGPDAAFACEMRNDTLASAWLERHGLAPKRFLCIIPRLRWTPYHKIHNRPATDSDHVKDAVNERTQRSDHEGLRQVIIRWVRETGLKVLACPEMTYQIELAKEELIDPLPDDVKAHVVWKDTYWLTDEATSVYRQAHSLISLENHSPILALGQGTPVIFVRQPTDTIKGQMWPDLGLGPDFFEVANATGDALWQRLSAIHADYPAAQDRVRHFMDNIVRLQGEMAGAVRSALLSRP